MLKLATKLRLMMPSLAAEQLRGSVRRAASMLRRSSRSCRFDVAREAACVKDAVVAVLVAEGGICDGSNIVDVTLILIDLDIFQ